MNVVVMEVVEVCWCWRCGGGGDGGVVVEVVLW